MSQLSLAYNMSPSPSCGCQRDDVITSSMKTSAPDYCAFLAHITDDESGVRRQEPPLSILLNSCDQISDRNTWREVL